MPRLNRTTVATLLQHHEFGGCKRFAGIVMGFVRELAAKALTPRQKSITRHVLSCVGLYELRTVEQYVDDVIRLDDATTFLQIGANDGYLADPLNLAIFRYKLRGTLVEPQLRFFSELKKTYSGFSGLEFIHCAIAEKAGSMRLYSLDCRQGNLPRWAHGCGSLSFAQLLRLKDQIPDVEKYITNCEVACITIRELLRRIDAADPDIIVIDAEGYDDQILVTVRFYDADSEASHF